MAHVTIPDQNTHVSYSVTTSSTGPFNVPFAIFDKADLTVEIDGVAISQSAFAFTPTSSTTGGYQTGYVTLGTAVAAVELLIYRTILPVRTSDMGPGPKDRDADNTQWDRFQAQLQDVRRDLARALLVGFGEDGSRLGDAPASGIEYLARKADGTIYQTDGPVAGVAPDSSWTSPLTSILGAGWPAQLAAAARSTTVRQGFGVGDLGTIDQYKLPGYTDTQALQAWSTGGDQTWTSPDNKVLQLTRDVSLTAEIHIPHNRILDLNGWTIRKAYNGNMFTMGENATIMNGMIDGNAGNGYTGNGITISGGVTNRAQRLLNLSIYFTRGYVLECVGDGSGSSLMWIGGNFYRYDPTLDAIKWPDTESGTTGLRTLAHLVGNGSSMLDVAGGRVTSIKACNAASITLRDASGYLIMDESRIVQIIDRVAVTGATKANPCVVTVPRHAHRTGDSVTFYDVGGMTELNGNSYTVTVVDPDNISIGVNSSGYGTYTSGGVAKNRSAHVVRGRPAASGGGHHIIQGIQGTSLDGSAVIRLAPGLANTAVDVHIGQTLQDDSGVTTNRVLTWHDRIQFGTNGSLTFEPGVDDIALIKVLNGLNGRWSLKTLAAAAGLGIDTQNNGSIKLRPNGSDGVTVSTTAITNSLPLVLSGDTTPANDNTQKMGTASFRYSELFAGNGTVNTSDATTKTPLEPIPDSVRRAMARILAGVGVFQFLDSVARKGPDKARLQIGVTAQAVRDAFAAEGEDAGRWSLFCADPVFENVEVSETERVYVPVESEGTREIVEYTVEQVEGRAIKKRIVRTEANPPETESVPVFDEDNNPVPDEARPLTDATGAVIPGAFHQLTYTRTKHEWRDVTRTRTEQRPVIDQRTGVQRVLLGLRSEQLFWLALACGDLGAAQTDPPVVPHEIEALMEPGETPRDASRRLTPLLIEEKAELQRVRALTGVTDPREAEVDQLLGLFARLGET